MQELSFEKAMERLAEITEALEGNETTLDQSMELFAEGLTLLKQCDQILKEYETKINEVIVEHQSDDK